MKVGDLVRLRGHINPNAWGVIVEEIRDPRRRDPLFENFMVLWSPKFQRLHSKTKWLCAAKRIEVISEGR